MLGSSDLAVTASVLNATLFVEFAGGTAGQGTREIATTEAHACLVVEVAAVAVLVFVDLSVPAGTALAVLNVKAATAAALEGAAGVAEASAR
jgi:hypothetical protein